MLPLLNNLKLNSSILSIGKNGNSVIIIDNTYHLYEIKSGEFIYSKQIFDFAAQHPFSKACAVSMQGSIAIGKPKTNECEILYIKDGNLKHVKTLSWHKADIYNIKFSRDGKYLLTGGEDGKAFVFSLPNFNIVHILPPRPDYISNVHFGKISKLIVYSSYDMINCVFSMENNKIIGLFETSSVVEDIVFFDNDDKIFFVCSNGETGIYDVISKKASIQQNYNSWLTRTGLSKDDNYAYIGSRDNVLSYLSLYNNTPQFNVPLNYDGISTMRIIENKLYIGYSIGYLQIFNLSKNEDEFKEAIANKDMKLASEISNNNITLKTYEIYIDAMNEAWIEEFKKIKKTLKENYSTQQIKKLYSELEFFFEDKNKKDEFNNYIANIGALDEFKEAINNKDYAMAYKIADNNDVIKNTNEFIELEEYFNKVFDEAQALISTQALSKANEILKPFINVASKKDLINNLLRNNDKFLQADRLLKSKHFADYFALAQNFQPITNTNGYQKAILVGEQIIATIDALESNNDFEKASELINLLIQFAPFKQIAQQRKEDLLTKMEFLKLYENKQYEKICASIDKYTILKGLPQFINLKNKFNSIFDNALNHSSIGSTETVFDVLHEYFSIPFWKDKIDGIFNISYLNEIEKYMKDSINNSAIDWAATIQIYANMFGKNDEIVKICGNNKEILKILDNTEANQEKEIQYLKSIIILK